MRSMPSAFGFLLMIFAEWVDRHQLKGATVTLSAPLLEADNSPAAGYA